MQPIEIIKALRQALKPFAEYVSGNAAQRMPADYVITNGSQIARRQLTFGDCKAAAAAINLTEGMESTPTIEGAAAVFGEPVEMAAIRCAKPDAPGWYVAREKTAADGDWWKIVRVDHNLTKRDPLAVWVAGDARPWPLDEFAFRVRLWP